MRSWSIGRRVAVGAGYLVFVLGGIAAGVLGFGSTLTVNRPAPAATSAPLSTAAAPTAAPTAVPLAAHPPLRDFDHSPPPFAPAPEATPVQEVSPAGRLTILLLGIDQRPDEAADGGDPGRTDSMVLVSIDYGAKTVSMASIPRDGFVTIPGHGNERVNAAYTFGELDQRGTGPELAKQTVSQLFGIPVDRYALVDIHSLERIVDTLGGVWIDNPYRLVDHAYPTDDYRTITIDIPAGRQLMDGTTAVEYARTRHPDSDYGREGRQQQVMLAIRDRILQLNMIPRLPALLPDMLNLVKTDLSPLEIGQIASFGRGIDASRDIVRLQPDPNLTPSYVGPGGASYINLTPTYRATVRLLVTAPRLAAEGARIQVFNAGALAGSGSKVADVLRQAGFPVNTIAVAPAPSPTTRIEAGPKAKLSAEAVAKLLGLPASAIQTEDDGSADIRLLLGSDFSVPRS